MKRLARVLPVILAVALQVFPLLRNLVASPAVGANFAFILRWGIGAGAVLGTVDAVSGASNYFTSPSSFTGTVGTYFTNSLTLKSTGTDGGAFATITTNGVTALLLNSGQSTNFGMPPGLVFTFYDQGGAYDAIYGTPTATGVYSFSVTMSRAGSASVSTNITITISTPANQPPAIAAQPGATNIAVSGTAVFSVAAGGTGPLAYQWLKDGNPLSSGGNISGANANALTVSPATTNDSGVYSVVITNSFGSATSSNATLNVLLPPSITSQPADTTNAAGTSATFSCTAGGSPALGYRWLKNSAPLADGAKFTGVTTSNLTVLNLVAADAANYSVVVTNSVGSVTSRLAALAVLSPPAITMQPASQTSAAGSTVAFSVSATGTGPFTYQWFRNSTPLGDGGNISGSTSNVLTLTSISTSNAGSYFVVVSNSLGSATSSNAVLTVLSLPVIVTQPTNQNAVVAKSVSISVGVDGGGPYAYQWGKITTSSKGTTTIKPIKGATNAVYSIASASTKNDGGYSVVVANGVGSVTSSVASLKVFVPITLKKQAASRTANAGTTTIFSTKLKGTAPIGFQWFKDGLPVVDDSRIIGANSNNLVITALTTNDTGGYSLMASNFANTVFTTSAQLTVIAPPVIVIPPTNQTVVVSNSVTFSVVVDGTAPLSYQWLKGKSKIKGATGATFTITSAQPGDAATNYAVSVSNAAGNAVSSFAALAVLPNALAMKTIVVGQPPGEIQIALNPDGAVNVSFTGTPNASYTLQAADNLENPGWQTVGTTLAQPDGTWQMSDPASQPQRFYRVSSP